MLSKLDIDKIEKINNVSEQIVVGLGRIIRQNLLPETPREQYRVFMDEDVIYVGLLNVNKIKMIYDKNKKGKAFQILCGINPKNKTHDFEKRVPIQDIDGVYVGIDIHGIAIKGIQNWNMSVLKQIDRNEGFDTKKQLMNTIR